MIRIELSRRNIIIISTIAIFFIAFIILIIHFFSGQISPKVSKNEYEPKVLVIYKQGTDNYLDIYQNYKQSYILNTQVFAEDDISVLNKNLDDYDLVYPDQSLITSSNIDKIKPLLISYASDGGRLFLENQWYQQFPYNFTGVTSDHLYDGKQYDFAYPKLDYNLNQLQLVVKEFIDDFVQYRKTDLQNLNIKTYTTTDAFSIATVDGFSIMSMKKYNKGYILISGTFPNSSYITGFDMTAKDSNQKYFDFSLATINYFVRNEFLAFSLKDKDGFVLKKVFGPYGRPAMAWQNHFEGLSSMKDKDMIKWSNLLQEYNQIPSFSLVRSSYDWGQWKSDITVHINKGNNTSPIFTGEYEDSHYSSGKTLAGSSDYITFGDYPDYKSLSDRIELPQRAYPTVVDYDADEDKDLIVGAPNGKLYLVRNIGTSQAPSFNDKEELNISVGSYAAPTAYDFNKDGLFDLVVGTSNGPISVFINKGSKGTPSFDSPTILQSVSVSGASAPAFGDIDGDGINDLVIGSSTGTLSIYKGSSNNFVSPSKINDKNIGSFSAPAIYDWNGDGKRDLLVGDNSGAIKVLINNNGTFSYVGNIAGETYNPQGNKGLIGGHNSVPVVTDWNSDGNFDLLVGQLEFGLPYDIDSPLFKYKPQLKEALDYVISNHIPVYPHFFTHGYKTSAQEETELALQKKSFEAYGLKWGNHGTDQHTWGTSNLGPAQSLISSMNAGAWWNFGFRPSNTDASPRDAKEYMWGTPFLLGSGTNSFNFIAFTPAPNMATYTNVYESFANFDMPLTYFEHIEYKLSNPTGTNELKQLAASLNKIRAAGEYNFMTQEQMAKSFLNTFTSRAYVTFTGDGLQISSDVSGVPDLAGEYKGTLGIKLERGEMYKDTAPSTNSDIYYYGPKNKDLYFGIGDGAEISFGKPGESSFHIVRSNVPFKKDKNKIDLLSPGLQELRIYSPKSLKITGDNIKVSDKDNYYTVTHYGDKTTISVK